MRTVAAVTVLAIVALLMLVVAQIVRTRDLDAMRARTITNCEKIEQLKAEIIRTTNVSSGLDAAQKTAARRRFAPTPC